MARQLSIYIGQDAPRDKESFLWIHKDENGNYTNQIYDGEWKNVSSAGSESAGALVSTTYEDLKTIRDESALIPGQQYRITDYHCTTIQENTRSADHQFDIIVTADSESVLNENARAILHESDTYFATCNLSAWELKYSLDNDTTRFSWAGSVQGKGVIYYMKDEFNNECPYDFKNIQFYRKWNSTKSLWCDDGTTSNGVPAYTFSSSGTSSTTSFTDRSLSVGYGFYSNVIKEYLFTKIILNNICFFGNQCYCNTFGTNCHSITLGDSSCSNTFGTNCYNNILGLGCASNTFGDECNSNTFGSTCFYNTFGTNCQSNTFGTYCNSNTFGNNCQFNTFGNYSAISCCRYISLGDGVQYCKIYGTTSPDYENYLQNIKIAQGLQGTSSTKLSISVATGLAYETYVSKNSSGELKIYCEADLVPTA